MDELLPFFLRKGLPSSWLALSALNFRSPCLSFLNAWIIAVLYVVAGDGTLDPMHAGLITYWLNDSPNPTRKISLGGLLQVMGRSSGSSPSGTVLTFQEITRRPIYVECSEQGHGSRKKF